ncbi:MAG TPA: TMEM165/GDT1 family protein [Coriobacteriia bacterium]
MLYAFLVATILIVLAELGDKTQLLALLLATRYKAWQVLVGIFGATLLIHLLSTLVGAAVGGFVPTAVLTWVAGVLFVGFGVWTLRGDSVDEDATERPSRFGPIVTSAIAFFLAEIGDKTQIMTMTIAADPGAALRTFGGFAAGWLPAGLAPPTGAPAFFGVWMGSTVGMVIADGLAIIVGAVLGKTLPEKLITRISGVLFILFGVGMIVAMYLR